MFDRYSERARRVLFFTRYEVSALGANKIQPAHVLLGLLHDTDIQRLLANWNIQPAELRQQIEPDAKGDTRIPTSVDVEFSESVQHLLKLAVEEADRLRHKHIEPEHLLIALLREDDALVAVRLKACGMDPDRTREYLASQPPVPGREPEIEVRSVNPDAALHLERIRQFVDELAQAESNSAEGRVLVKFIDEELMMLMNLWGR